MRRQNTFTTSLITLHGLPSKELHAKPVSFSDKLHNFFASSMFIDSSLESPTTNACPVADEPGEIVLL
jgi:hypothetical protein